MSFKRIVFQRAPEAAEQVAAEPVEGNAVKEGNAGERNWGYRNDPDTVTEEVEEEEEEVEKKEPAKETPPADVKAEETPPADAALAAAASWKQEVKKADKWEVLKELGYDDFTVGMLKYKEQTGDYTPYITAKSVDYTKMKEEDLFRHDLRRRHPGISEKALDYKLRKEFIDKYSLDRDEYPETSDEAEIGAELLQLDSETLRKQLIEEQAKFKPPDKPADVDAPKREAEHKERVEKMTGVLLNNPSTKALQKAKAISFGQGEESFTYPVADVQPLIDNALKTLIDSQTTQIEDGALLNFYKLLAIGQNVDAFEKSLADHYKKIGHRKVQNEIQNVTPINNANGEPQTGLTPAQQLARHGKVT